MTNITTSSARSVKSSFFVIGGTLFHSRGRPDPSPTNAALHRVVFLSYPKGSGFTGGEEALTVALNCVPRSAKNAMEMGQIMQTVGHE
jgi:hypothetical protein